MFESSEEDLSDQCDFNDEIDSDFEQVFEANKVADPNIEELMRQLQEKTLCI